MPPRAHRTATAGSIHAPLPRRRPRPRAIERSATAPSATTIASKSPTRWAALGAPSRRRRAAACGGGSIRRRNRASPRRSSGRQRLGSSDERAARRATATAGRRLTWRSFALEFAARASRRRRRCLRRGRRWSRATGSGRTRAEPVGHREVAAAVDGFTRCRLRAWRAVPRARSASSRRVAERVVGTHRDARCARAWPASTASPTTSMRSASATPPARVSRCVPPQHGSSPAPTSGNAIVACSPDHADVGRQQQLRARADRRAVPHRDRGCRERGEQRRRIAQARAAWATRGSAAPTPSRASSSSARADRLARSSATRRSAAARRARRRSANGPGASAIVATRAAPVPTHVSAVDVGELAHLGALGVGELPRARGRRVRLAPAPATWRPRSRSRPWACPRATRARARAACARGPRRTPRAARPRRIRSSESIAPARSPHAASRVPSGAGSPRLYLPVSIPLASGK